MELLRITTDDYELTVRANGIDTAFRKAAIRNSSIVNSTEYSFVGGNLNSFELCNCNNNELDHYMSESYLNSPSHPIFFENKDYYFDIVFFKPTLAEPIIYTPLQEIKKTFVSRKIKDAHFLTGAINYRNDIGKTDLILRYEKNQDIITHKLTFEVFPVKLDYKSDYKSILSDINKEFSSLVFDVLKKTYTGFKNGNQINNDIIWWGIFGQLYKDIIFSARMILNRPHNRLVNENYFSKADKTKFLDFDLEEKIAEHRENDQKYYRVRKKILTTNTFENQFFKYSIIYVKGKFISIKNKLLALSGIRITDDFRLELEGIEKELLAVSNNPFFKSIQEFKGLKQESLVLQKATGYSSLFRAWIILKRGIDFLDGVNKIELKNIADLYQIWCFIEIKNMIKQILKKEPEQINLAEILMEGFAIQLKSGRTSRVSFKKENGDLVELYHEMKYTNNISDNTLSHTVIQEPDIVLRITKNDLKENYQFTYLFDAKYRLESDAKEGAQDFPPDDAINQMHRYRDAIFYQEDKLKEKPKKEIIGAYVLFPGADNAEEVEKLYFQKSIRNVNIGAYPLIPGSKKNYNSSLLNSFLKTKLDIKESLDILTEDILPYKGMKYEDPDALVLAGFVASEEQRIYFTEGVPKIYHLPVYKRNGKLNTIRNLDKLKYFCPIINGVIEYFEIKDIKVIPRSEIFESTHKLYRNSDEPYFVFMIMNRKKLNNKIEPSIGGNRVFRYAKISELIHSKTINDLNKTIQEEEE
ncbi:DUF2357 domain-containing protein, partial [Flavobacterium sp.]|uniref:DUF2357 domain-containing protein n=1 Tax=Flavobacterium sp. TaxID=239 RepID=UPI0026043F24